jgi:hypothetical protein
MLPKGSTISVSVAKAARFRSVGVPTPLVTLWASALAFDLQYLTSFTTLLIISGSGRFFFFFINRKGLWKLVGYVTPVLEQEELPEKISLIRFTKNIAENTAKDFIWLKFVFIL